MRLSVVLERPLPMAGFHITTSIRRDGRSVATVDALVTDDDHRTLAHAEGLLLKAEGDAGPAEPEAAFGSSDDASPGKFVIERTLHGLPCFIHAVEARYPAGEDPSPGDTRLWLRCKVPLLPNEKPSPFQAICPLADCGNAIGRRQEPVHTLFANADLVISLHRPPVSEWFGMHAAGYWNSDGTGTSDASLHDAQGPVGRALQTLVLRPGPEHKN